MFRDDFKKVAIILTIAALVILAIDSFMEEKKESVFSKDTIFNYVDDADVKSPPKGMEKFSSNEIKKCKILKNKKINSWGKPPREEYIISYYGKSRDGYFYYQTKSQSIEIGDLIRSNENLFKE